MPKKARTKAPEPQAADDGVPRCHWAAHPCSERSRAYHDEIWGTPLCDDQALFEQLSLCSQQCGLSWSVIWNKRSDYQQAFHGFDMQRVAAMDEASVRALVDSPLGVIHNYNKLNAIVHNARLCAAIAKRTKGGLTEYLWSFTGGTAAVNTRRFSPGGDASWVGRKPSDATGPAAVHPASEKMATALKAEGFKFLGAITLTAFMQQVGIVNDHCCTCYKNPLSGSCGSPRQPQATQQATQQQPRRRVGAKASPAESRPATPSVRKRKKSTTEAPAAPARRSTRAGRQTVQQQ
jgi:DNA-3-methyladenine glycosylase I